MMSACFLQFLRFPISGHIRHLNPIINIQISKGGNVPMQFSTEECFRICRTIFALQQAKTQIRLGLRAILYPASNYLYILIGKICKPLESRTEMRQCDVIMTS